MAILVGVHEDPTAIGGGRTPTQVKTAFPGSNLGRAFIGTRMDDPNVDIVAKAKFALAPYIAANTSRILLSMKSNVQRTLDGDFDNAYDTLGAYLAAQNLLTRVMIIPWHEPEDDTTSEGGFSGGTEYTDYFKKVRTAIRTGGRSIRCGIASNSNEWRPKPGNPALSQNGRTDVPADWRTASYDFRAIDFYSGRVEELNVIAPEHKGFIRWSSLFLTSTQQWIAGERGFETPSLNRPLVRFQLRAQTIDREAAWLNTSALGQRCEMYNYWNSPGKENAQGLRLDPLLGEPALRRLIVTVA